MIEVYYFKVFNKIGNILTIGKMASSKDEVIAHCEKAIRNAKEFTDCKWYYHIELVER